MIKKLTDEFDPIDLEDFIVALNAAPEGGQIEFSELMNYFQNQNGGKPMYLDIPSYSHDAKWLLPLLEKLVTKDGKAFSSVDTLWNRQVRWMLAIYESNHKNQHLIQSQ